MIAIVMVVALTALALYLIVRDFHFSLPRFTDEDIEDFFNYNPPRRKKCDNCKHGFHDVRNYNGRAVCDECYRKLTTRQLPRCSFCKKTAWGGKWNERNEWVCFPCQYQGRNAEKTSYVSGQIRSKAIYNNKPVVYDIKITEIPSEL